MAKRPRRVYRFVRKASISRVLVAVFGQIPQWTVGRRESRCIKSIGFDRFEEPRVWASTSCAACLPVKALTVALSLRVIGVAAGVQAATPFAEARLGLHLHL